MNCDRIARWYRWFEYAGFGRGLERRRQAFLNDIADARRVLALGFSCKGAIHPSQVAPIHDAFVPAAAELQWARDLLDSPGAHEGGAFLFQGKMVDAPVLAKARRLTERVR